MTAIQAYGQTAISSYTGADAGNLSSNCPIEVTVPSEIDSKAIDWIGDSAFKDSGITAITVPSSISTIGDNAFFGRSLRSINFEGSPSFSGQTLANAPIDTLSYSGSTFRSSDSVEERCFLVDASGYLLQYFYLDVQTLGNHGFTCLSRNVDIPATVNGIQIKVIDRRAFTIRLFGPSSGIRSGHFLESVTTPEGVTTIESESFAYNQLKSVVIPSSVTHIEESALSMQNPSGYAAMDEFWSGDPARAQAAYKTINYVQLKLADPTNPHGLMSASAIERDGLDLNGNGQDDDYVSMGGHIIGASPVQPNFQDGSGNQLRPNQLITGETSDGTQLTSFLVADTPLPPAPSPVHPWDPPTQEELQAISDFLESTFFTTGRAFNYTTPVINGITPTPASFNGQLTSGLNNIQLHLRYI